MRIKENNRILFQGDSITDAGRQRAVAGDLGNGYVAMIAALVSAAWPEMQLEFINRGISGNRVSDLKARWDEDCIALRPDVVSIMIGINDCWRRYDSNDPVPADAFYNDYRHILTRLKQELDPLIVLCEPFVLPCPPDRTRWREDLDPKINAVRTLAREFGALLAPLDGLFSSAATLRPPEFWAADGVHPTHSGNALIAREWLRTMKVTLC